ncbi:F-box protein [Aspergillus melleus]|uniref:F-box protein n=1 Tax=Aspergillus melleus TaxID=138277 RepID=UPI001E8D8853|nr:uncharacterized protein LDX57_003810 [Aspergillus melleus]KAH8426069.1 hypothetical protein LDX57_003810 [Aspergillus melleus]
MDLPFELLHQIASYLSPAESTNVGLTCRRMYPVFINSRYRDIIFLTPRDDAAWDLCRRICLLLRTLLLNPLLRPLVHRFEIHYSNIEYKDSFPDPLWTTEEFAPGELGYNHNCWLGEKGLKQLKAHIRTEQSQADALWFDCLDYGQKGATIAVLLSLMPNLEFLYLDVGLHVSTISFARLTQHAISRLQSESQSQSRSPSQSPIPLANLKHVTYAPLRGKFFGKYSGEDEPYDLDSVMFDPNQIPLLFYLPRIQSIAGLMPHYPDFSWTDISCLPPSLSTRPNATTLTSLRLRNSPLGASELKVLLSATPNLQSLFYEVIPPFKTLSMDAWVQPFQRGLVWEFDTSMLAPALHQVPALQELHIRYNLPSLEDSEIQITRLSLAPLTRLRKLAMQLPLLMWGRPEDGPPTLDSLPPSLESLTILDWEGSYVTEYPEDLIEGVRPFLESRGNGQSALEEVSMAPAYLYETAETTPEEAIEKVWERWEDLGRRNGVVCVARW